MSTSIKANGERVRVSSPSLAPTTRVNEDRTRLGGSSKHRWSVRRIIAAGILLLLLFPYDREVVGKCRVIPLRQMSIRAQVPGEILAVFVSEGDSVQAGQIIGKLDDREYLKELRGMRAERDQLQAELDKLQTGPRAEDLAIAQEELALEQARLAHHETDLKIKSQLLESDTVPEVVIARADLELQRAQLAHDESELLRKSRLAETNSVPEVAIAREELELEKLRLAHDEEGLVRTEELYKQKAASDEELVDARFARDSSLHRVPSAQAKLDKAIQDSDEDLARTRLSRDSGIQLVAAAVGKLAREQRDTAEDLNQTRLERDSQIHLVASADENLKKLETGAREEDLRAKRAEIEKIVANIDYYTKAVELTEIKAPIDGRVITPYLSESLGHALEIGDLIAVVQDASQLTVEIAAEESAGALIHPGLKTAVRLYGLDGDLNAGHVRSIAGATSSRDEFESEPFRSDREVQLERARDQTGMDYIVRVYSDLEPGSKQLIPGMTGVARITIGGSQLWREFVRPVEGFLFTEVWSWLP